MLTWSQRFHLRVWIRSSMWLIPMVFVLLSIGLAVLMPWVDSRIEGESSFAYSASSAQSTLSAIASGMLVFTGFVFSVLTFAIGFAAGTFTPRLIRAIAVDVNTKVSLGVFTATFIYALLLLADVAPGEGEDVPQYSVLLAVVLVGVSILFFLGMIVSVTGSLRPGRVAALVSRYGREVIAGLFPEPAVSPEGPAVERVQPDTPSRLVGNHRSGGGVLQALDPGGIVSIAEDSGVTVEMVPAVGDFVPNGAPVFKVYGGNGTQEYGRLLDSVAFGEERTFRQDPPYAIRILVDIAIRALSPAVNDPTTALEALGRIEDLLLSVGTRQLPDGVYRGEDGEVRFVYRTSTWDEYVYLAFTEIRTYGADSPLVVDELRNLFGRLRELVPVWRRESVDEQSRLLEAAIPAATR